MNTHTFIHRYIEKVALAVVVGTAAFLLVTIPAQAQVTPSVTAVIRDASNNATSTVSVGSMIHVRATVASSTSSTSPTGTVDFTRYNGTICSGTGTLFEQNTALNNGVADSDPITAPLGGVSFRVHYDGQGDMFAQATSTCVSVSVNQYMPTLTLSLSSTTVYAGSYVHATSTLANATSTAGGTVAYRVYSNNTCTNLYQNVGTSSVTVTNGYVPWSYGIQFNTPGTYYWQGVYSGDANTMAATSTCANAVLNVLATSTATSTGDGSISGKIYHDLNKNRTLDTGEAGLSGFTVWLFNQSTKQHKEQNVFRTVVSDSNGNYSFTNLPDGKYRVELKEQKENGWKQITSDYKSLVIANGADLTDKNFGNASTTPKGDGNGSGGNGNNNWWFFQGGWFFGGVGNGTTTIPDFFMSNKNFFQNLFSNWNWN